MSTLALPDARVLAQEPTTGLADCLSGHSRGSISAVAGTPRVSDARPAWRRHISDRLRSHGVRRQMCLPEPGTKDPGFERLGQLRGFATNDLRYKSEFHYCSEFNVEKSLIRQQSGRIVWPLQHPILRHDRFRDCLWVVAAATLLLVVLGILGYRRQ